MQTNHALVANFWHGKYVFQVVPSFFNAIHENQILTKISKFTAHGSDEKTKDHSDLIVSNFM